MIISGLINPINAQTLPPGKRLNIGGETYQCYNFDEQKKIFGLEFDLGFCNRSKQLLEEKLKIQINTIDDLTKTVESQRHDINILTSRSNRLQEMWEQENKKRLEAENKPNYGGLSWLVIAGIGAMVGGITVGLIAASN